MECGRAESGKPPTQGLPAVDGSVLTSVPVRRTQDQTRCMSMSSGGVRVGEASHQGPRRRRLVRSSSVESSRSGPGRTLLDDFERDLFASGLERTAGTQIDASSDDEPSDAPQQWQACCAQNE